MEITKFIGSGGEQFRKFILQNPNTLIYSEPRFIELISEHLDARSEWLVLRRDGEIKALLPYLVKEGPLGPAFNSLAYFGSNGGVIQIENDMKDKIALVDTYFKIAADAKALSATIISNPLERDAKFYDFYSKHNFHDERVSQITHLPENIDQLLVKFDDPRPRNIRRAIKEGVTVTKDKEAGLEFLFNTHVDNMKAIGGLAKKKEFFDAIPGKMQTGDWAVFTAKLNGSPIAALLLFYFNRTVEYFTPVIVESHRNTQALALVIYEAMCDAILRSFANWNWGGTWLSQGGVYDFKKRWGTTDYRYFYYTHVFNIDIKKYTPAFLQKQYPGFYLIPFNQLA